MKEKIYALFACGAHNHTGEYTFIGRIKYIKDMEQFHAHSVNGIGFVVGEADKAANEGNSLDEIIWSFDNYTTDSGTKLMVTIFPDYKVVS